MSGQPNIIFILIDDMGWMDLTCQGSDFYETPNIDRLAREGMTFTEAYASCPVCSPTRASIMSGKYPSRVGITNFIAGNAVGKLLSTPYYHELPRTETSIAQALRDGGYSTFHVGKWHLGREGHWPEDHGFEKNVAGCHWGMPAKGYFAPWEMPNMPEGEDGEYLTDALTTHAIDLIRNRELGKPFFLNFNHYAVHTPIQSPPELIQKYKEKAKTLGLDKKKTFALGEYHPCLHKKHQRVKRRLIQSDAAYAAMVENLDTNIGRLLDALDELGIADDTAVFFTSDNGGLSTSEGSPTCNFPLAEGKGWMYEGGTREPLLVRWPGKVKPASKSEAITTSPDFYPTFLEMAGLDLKPEQHVDGKSILPALQGDETFDRGPVYWHYPHYSNQGGTPGCSIREGEYKLIEFFEDGKLELYNLVDDLSEENDLAKEMPEKVKDLHAKLVAWREEADAFIPEPNPDYEDHLFDRKPFPANNEFPARPLPAGG